MTISSLVKKSLPDDRNQGTVQMPATIVAGAIDGLRASDGVSAYHFIGQRVCLHKD